MASPITALGAATIGPTASVTTPGAEMVMNGPTQPTSQTAPTGPAAGAAPQQPTRDTVELSPKALDLSKELTTRKLTENQQEENKQPALANDEVKRKLAEPVIQKPTDKPDISIIKNFPPFMGNTDALKQLKQVSPALYRQVLSMIVPPPVNISYSDQQYLQKPTIDSRT